MRAQILAKLGRKEFVSGQQIADQLSISRTAVYKHIKALRKIGFIIESFPRKGYRLVRQTKKLHPLVVNSCLKTKFTGRPLLHFDQVASTINQVMLRAGKSCEGLVVVAEKQTKARGRFQRHWSSPPGGIWASILLKPKCLPSDAAKLNLIASLAIAESIEQITAIKAFIKWPNDVIVCNLKVAGILTDMAAEIDKINYAVLSFGLNANNRIPAELSQGKKPIAISLKEAKGKPIDRLSLFCEIFKRFEDYYIQWQERSFEGILRSWKKRCLTIGKTIEVKGLGVGAQCAVPLRGKAVNVNHDGRLILKTTDGQKHYLSAGQVTIV